MLYAGLAAELAVTNLIRTYLADVGHTNIDRELRANSMLGRLCVYRVRECAGTMPTDLRTLGLGDAGFCLTFGAAGKLTALGPGRPSTSGRFRVIRGE